MLTRRIVTSVCALCFVLPAAADATPGTGPPTALGPYGITAATGPAATAKARGPYGITPAGAPSTVKARGPYGITPAGPPSTVKARGPYGITPVTGARDTTAASVHAAGASGRESSNGWRTAAICAAALIAALALGSTLLLPALRHGARMVT